MLEFVVKLSAYATLLWVVVPLLDVVWALFRVLLELGDLPPLSGYLVPNVIIVSYLGGACWLAWFQ